MDSTNIFNRVQEHYSSIASSQNSTYSSAVARAFGYTEEELNNIPQAANLGLSCGNPLAIASLREGETVIDLGSGAGFDVFLAAKKVGLQGRIIGVDMNKDMLARARNNQAKLTDANNISFVEANITSIPLDNGIADCIISNCVINLVPEAEKRAVFAEIGRLLKPGGRVAISDILARKPLPVEIRENMALYVGCVAGCGKEEDYKQFLKESGFCDIVIVDTETDLNVYQNTTKDEEGKNEDPARCCGPSNGGNTPSEVKPALCCTEEKKAAGCCSSQDPTHCCDSSGSRSSLSAAKLECGSAARFDKQKSLTFELEPADIDINEWAGSFKIFAVKTDCNDEAT